MSWWVLCAGQGMLILYFMFLCIGLKASEPVVYTFCISHTDSQPYKHNDYNCQYQTAVLMNHLAFKCVEKNSG
jgi:hypothetical protein